VILLQGLKSLLGLNKLGLGVLQLSLEVGVDILLYLLVVLDLDKTLLGSLLLLQQLFFVRSIHLGLKNSILDADLTLFEEFVE